jgi:hypothetical protein
MKQNNSWAWKILLKIKQIYIRERILVIGNGKSTDIWNDTWCGRDPLSVIFHDLFHICNQQICTVKKMFDLNWNFTFRRWLDTVL